MGTVLTVLLVLAALAVGFDAGVRVAERRQARDAVPAPPVDDDPDQWSDPHNPWKPR